MRRDTEEARVVVLKRWADGQDTAMIAVGVFMRESDVVRIIHQDQDHRWKASCEGKRFEV